MRTFLAHVAFAPFLVSVMAQNADKGELLSIIGTGDVMLGSNYPTAAKLPVDDGKGLLRNVKGILADADVTFGNLEGCFLDSGGQAKNCKSDGWCYFFRMPNRYAAYLTEAGYDVMNIANNHNGDFGQAGRDTTVSTLRNAGLAFAGLKDVCETARFVINGVKYGFCGFAPNSGTVRITDLAYARKLVEELDKDCDVVIVSFHGGAEGKAHNRVTRASEMFYGENRGNVYQFAHEMVDAGADVVFGHGPHVVRAAELYKDRFIIYSLGNFCTSGDFSISGISGYAPIVKVFTDRSGRFVKGQIFSFLQKDKTGPVADEDHAAAKEIKRLTEMDFPETQLTISPEGAIEKKQLTGEVQYGDFLEYTVNCDTVYVAQSIIDYSKQFIGKPYRRGSKGPKAFDCSGFTSFIFRNFGYRLSASCLAQVMQGNRVDISELKTGDLIFFKGRNIQSKYVGHVGIVISNDEDGNVSFIHACRRGVSIDQLNKSRYYKPRYVTGLRVLG